jgi:hypothetical protein
MAIPHYAYLVLKIPGPHGVISVRGDVKHAYDCDGERYEMIDRLMTFAELQELKKALAEPPPGPGHAQGQDVHLAGGLTQQDGPAFP